jgi:hypothetical protein
VDQLPEPALHVLVCASTWLGHRNTAAAVAIAIVIFETRLFTRPFGKFMFSLPPAAGQA